MGVIFKVKGFQPAKALFANMFGKVDLAMKKAITDWAFRTEGEIKDNIKSKLNQRTGNLRNSVHHEIHKSHGGWDYKIAFLAGGNEAPYALLHEEGGVQTPKKAKALTIPFKWSIGTKASDYPKDSKLVYDGIIWELTSSRNALKRPLFALKKSVKIPKRPYMAPAIQAMLPKLASDVDTLFKKYGKSKG